MDQPKSAITYTFHLGGGVTETVPLHFDDVSFLLKVEDFDPGQTWTALGFHQCADCPLDPAQSPECPFARALAPFIGHFERFYSYDTAIVEIRTSRRAIVGEGPLQRSMASLVGLIGATSGCPRLAFFRPMARLHLPFASEEETLFRAFSTYLLGQYLRSGGHGPQTVEVAGLQEQYAAVSLVNRGMAERIRGAFAKDAVVNAIVILDTFAQAIPFVVEESLDELRRVFAIG